MQNKMQAVVEYRNPLSLNDGKKYLKAHLILKLYSKVEDIFQYTNE